MELCLLITNYSSYNTSYEISEWISKMKMGSRHIIVTQKIELRHNCLLHYLNRSNELQLKYINRTEVSYSQLEHPTSLVFGRACRYCIDRSPSVYSNLEFIPWRFIIEWVISIIDWTLCESTTFRVSSLIGDWQIHVWRFLKSSTLKNELWVE